MKLILLGAPGAGKGTQSELISERYGVAHISTGDMLRSEIAAGTELGKLADSLIHEGHLVPDDVIIAMVKKRIAKDDCKRGFLLDGFPRTMAQAEELSDICEIDAVINIDVDTDVIVNRVASRRICKQCGHSQSALDGGGECCDKCGNELMQRLDDSPERVRYRLNIYREQTMPLINYYSEREMLLTIDGAKAIADVSRTIFDYVDGIIRKKKLDSDGE